MPRRVWSFGLATRGGSVEEPAGTPGDPRTPRPTVSRVPYGGESKEWGGGGMLVHRDLSECGFFGPPHADLLNDTRRLDLLAMLPADLLDDTRRMDLLAQPIADLPHGPGHGG